MRKALLLALLCAFAVIPVFATELLQNPGFETGQIAPWFQDRDFCGFTCVDWAATNTKAHSGTYSATVTGNIELRQNFTPTPGSSITDVSFWAIAGLGFGAIDFFYTDNSDEEFLYNASPTDWTFLDVTSDVNKNKTLMGFSVWGGDPAGKYYYDDLSVQAVPEPGSLVLLGSAILGLGGLARRKFNL